MNTFLSLYYSIVHRLHDGLYVEYPISKSIRYCCFVAFIYHTFDSYSSSGQARSLKVISLSLSPVARTSWRLFFDIGDWISTPVPRGRSPNQVSFSALESSRVCQQWTSKVLFSKKGRNPSDLVFSFPLAKLFLQRAFPCRCA